MRAVHRKTASSANKCQMAFEFNSDAMQFDGSTATNQAEDGTLRAEVSGRDTGYLNTAEIITGTKISANFSGALTYAHVHNQSNDMPNAQITTLTVQGMREGSSITVGADELQAYTYAIS